MAKKEQFSIYLSYLLRHHPQDVNLDMDKHGWVNVNQLIENINKAGVYTIDIDLLKMIVSQDKKGRYRFKNHYTYIKACQGHSIDWVEPELEYKEPPMYLYHGTNIEAYEKIVESGFISKMKRHAVHLNADESKSWSSAKRWKKESILLQIDALKMYTDGYIFGVSENGVWCVEKVPIQYIKCIIKEKG